MVDYLHILSRIFNCINWICEKTNVLYEVTPILLWLIFLFLLFSNRYCWSHTKKSSERNKTFHRSSNFVRFRCFSIYSIISIRFSRSPCRFNQRMCWPRLFLISIHFFARWIVSFIGNNMFVWWSLLFRSLFMSSMDDNWRRTLREKMSVKKLCGVVFFCIKKMKFEILINYAFVLLRELKGN